jgi:hypothetical protein
LLYSLSSNFVEYIRIKDVKMYEVFDYLDVGEKKNRLEKMQEMITSQDNWIKDFKNKKPI